LFEDESNQIKNSVNRPSVKGKKIKALILSALPALIGGVLSLFSEDAFIDFDAKNYLNKNTMQVNEIMNYDLIIYDEPNNITINDSLLNLILNNKQNHVHNSNNNPKPKIIVYTEKHDLNNIKRFIYLGVDGIVSKYSDEEKLKEAVNKVLNKGKYYCEIIQEALFKSYKYEAILSPRQMEISYYLLEGLNYKQIAQKINRASGTVNKHVENMKIKLEAKSIKELIEKLKS